MAARAKQDGICGGTAYKYFHAGCLPVPAVQLPTGTILVQEPTPALPGAGTALYARVSSADQRADLDRQLGRLVAWAAEGGLAVTRTVPEAGSGLNGRRPKLARLLPGQASGPSSPGTATGWPALAPSTQRPPLPPRAGAPSWWTATSWPTSRCGT